MSNRTLIEINHDYARDINTVGFLDAIAVYVRHADKESREALEQYGIRVFGTRHHSDGFDIKWGTSKATEPGV